MFRTFGGRQPPVIWLCADAVFIEISRQRFGAFSAGTIDNPALARPGANKFSQLFVRRRFWNDTIREVRPIKAGDVTAWLAQLQFFDDVAPDTLGCCRSQRHHRYVRQMLP